MRLTATIGVVGLLYLAAAQAQPAATTSKDPFVNFYGNTMESKHQDGQVFRVYFNPDHTYKVLDKDGKVVRDGTYTYKDKKLCFYKDGKAIECPPFRADLKMGETWDAGKTDHHDYLTLKPGRD
jgi:hypothetical protein